MDGACAALQLRVREAVGLHQLEQSLRRRDLHGRHPEVEQRAGIGGAEVPALGPGPGAALTDDALGEAHDGGGVDHGSGRRLRGVAEAELRRQAAGCQRQRRVRPLGGAALLAAGLRPAGADVGQKLFRRGRGRRSRERPADVHTGVVVGARDPGPAVGLDVDGSRHVELRGARSVADLPDLEHPRQPAPVARGQRRFDGVEGMGERAGDVVRLQVLGAGLDAAVVTLQPLVILRSDPETEDVHRLVLAPEPGRQLLGDEDVGQMRDLERPVDRVVIGDRHEVHAAALGELVDLLGRRRALGQSGAALDAELRELRGRAVAVEIGAGLVVIRALARRAVCVLDGNHRCSFLRFSFDSPQASTRGRAALVKGRGTSRESAVNSNRRLEVLQIGRLQERHETAPSLWNGPADGAARDAVDLRRTPRRRPGDGRGKRRRRNLVAARRRRGPPGHPPLGPGR